MDENASKRLAQIDQAIDEMDLERIEQLLDHLDESQTDQIQAEEPKLFAARIQRIQQEREKPMKHYNMKRIMILAACLTAALSVGVYASGVWKNISFANGSSYVTVITDEKGMTEKDARALASEANVPVDPENTRVIHMEQTDFASVEQAQRALDMTVVLPQELANFQLESVSGEYSDYSKLLHINYAEGKKKFGVTIYENIPPENGGAVVMTSDMEEGSEGKYKNATGNLFTTLREGDGNGKFAEIYTIWLGNYEYSLVFFDIPEQEMRAIVDSVDLSAYK